MAWIFDQDVFRIHSICLNIQKGKQPIPDRLRVGVIPVHATLTAGHLNFQKGNPIVYVPCNLSSIESEGALVKRLIPENEVPAILPQGKSPYMRKFYQGASLVPRSFLFVEVHDCKNTIATILPDTRIPQKPPWNFSPYKKARVEQQYLFSVAKSNDLVPFGFLQTNMIFLPVTRDTMMFNEGHLMPLAQQHFARLCDLYISHQKQGASIRTLWDRINFNKGLSNLAQMHLLKVIFPGSGGIVKAAIVRGEMLVDTSCYYFGTESENEAYYITGILNAPSISSDLKRRGSTGAQGGITAPA